MSTPTLSLCIPSSTIGPIACRSQQQASHIAHQISRAAVLYGASEIVVYDVGKEEDRKEGGEVAGDEEKPKKVVFDEEGENLNEKMEKDRQAKNGPSDESIRLASLLQYYITPSYLRKSLFPDLGPLQYAKKLPKIPGLPFLSHKNGKFLEGLTVRSKPPKSIGGVKKKGRENQKNNYN